MKRLKKVFAGAMALTLAFSMVACSQKTEEKKSDAPAEQTKVEGKAFEGKTLKLAGLNSGYGTAGWEAVIKAFEEQTGAKVEAKFEKNIAEVIRPQIQSGDTPDVIYMSIGGEGGLTETMIKEEMVEDITSVLGQKILGEEKTVGEKIIPGFTGNNNTNPYNNDKVYLAPLFYTPCGLFYNKANFAEGKYQLPKTFDEFYALGEKAKGDGLALFTYPTTGYFDSFVPSLLNEVGGEEFFNKAMKYDVDAWKSDEAKMSFETIAKIAPYLQADTVSNTNIKDGFKNNQQAVIDGKALFIPNGAWLPGEMKETTPEGFEWGFMPLLAVKDGGDRYAFTFFEQVFIPSEAKEKDLAKEFVAFLYSDVAVKAFYENGGAVQPVLGAKDLISDETNKEIYSIYDDGTKVAMGGFVAAPPVEGVDIKEALYDSINSVMTGDKTVQDWQDGVVNAATKISENMK